MSRSGRASCSSSSASRAYFIASAPPLEKPTMCSGFAGPTRRRASRTASRVAASQSSHSTSVRAAGTVPWRRHPDRDGDEAVVAIAARDVAQAVGRIGQAVQQHDRADRRAVGLEDVGAVPVLREAAGIDRRCRRSSGCPGPRAPASSLSMTSRPHIAEDRLFRLEVGGPVAPCRSRPHACRAARRYATARAAARAGNPRRATPGSRPRPRPAGRAHA